MNSGSVADALQIVAQKRIVFAHQSVGNDILEGVRVAASKHQQPIQIIESRTPPPDWKGILHFKVGENGSPNKKIADFSETLGEEAFRSADIALLKLCYIDFDASTNVSEVAKSYGDTLEALQAKHPETRFVAVTAPLTTIQTGPKAWIKRLLGRTPSGYEDNYRRLMFNEQLRARFGEGRLFDIAKLESSSNGGAGLFEFKSREVESLDPALTYDGGHLDAAGKALVSAALLDFVATLPEQPR